MNGTGRLIVVAVVLLALAVCLHLPVFTRGALITPAGMHYAQWPWKSQAQSALARGALLEENHSLSDLLFQVHPWQVHVTRSLQRGAIPLWNPYSYCGVPFLANAQSAVLYPLHWPVWLVPSLRVFTLALLCKIVAAGFFMAIFLRGAGLSAIPCVVGSVSFALCGFMTVWLGYAHTNAAVLLPLLMHAARSLAARPGVGPLLMMAFAAAAHHLGGHPETSLQITIAAAFYFLWCLPSSPRPWRASALFTGASVLGFLMAAAQAFPFIEYLLKSAALQERRSLPGMDPTLPPDAPLALLLPAHHGLPWNFTYHGPVPFQTMAGYAGAGVLLLALLAPIRDRRTRFFQLMAVICGVIVYGPPAVRSLLRPIPLVGISANHRYLLLISFGLATLAAYALQTLALESGGSSRWGRAGTLVWLVSATLLLLVPCVAETATDARGAWFAASIVVGTALLSALALLRPGRATVYLIGVAGITCLDMFVFARGFNPHADPKALFPSTKLTDFVRKEISTDPVRGGRIMTVAWTMRPETQMIYGLSSIEGYDAMEYATYRHMAERARVPEIHKTGEIPADSRALLNLMGLRFIITPPGGVVSGEAMRLGYDGPDGRVFINEQALPRVSFVGRARLRAGQPAALGEGRGSAELDLLASGALDPTNEVLLGTAPVETSRAPEISGNSEPSIRLVRDLPGDLLIEVPGLTASGYLVLSEAYDAGWRARVDGSPVEVLRANGNFMAVRLTGGAAAVTLTYSPRSFTIGAWVSALCLLCVVTAGIAWRGGESRGGAKQA